MLPALPVLVQVMDVMHLDEDVVLLVLLFFCEFSEAQLAYLGPSDAALLYEACGQLFKVYSKHNFGVVAAAQKVEEDGNYQALLNLVRLLGNIVSKDFLDFSDPQPGLEHTAVSVIEVCLENPSASTNSPDQSFLCFCVLCCPQPITCVLFWFVL
jgi:hypothetical protein